MPDDFEDQFAAGLDLFNSEEFYDCHDTIEEIWLQESSDQRPFLQGLIQAAVAFHHFQQGSWGAARSMLRLAIEKLDPYPDRHKGIRLARLVEELKLWKKGLDSAVSSGGRDDLGIPFPKIARVAADPPEPEG